MTNYRIPMNEASDEFRECWVAAGKHLVSQVDNGSLKFFRANLTPPILEHLSFILGNQIFFVHVRPLDPNVAPPSPLASCIHAAELANGMPCVLRLKRQTDDRWTPVDPGWGLRHAESGAVVDPVALISDEKIEISDWELQDFCVQVVRDKISDGGGTILSWNSNPEVTPNLFFVDEQEKQHFVIVCCARYPHSPIKPANVKAIKDSVSSVTKSGYLAQVSVASAEDPYDPEAKINGNFLPLYRGHPFHIAYKGLEVITDRH